MQVWKQKLRLVIPSTFWVHMAVKVAFRAVSVQQKLCRLTRKHILAYDSFWFSLFLLPWQWNLLVILQFLSAIQILPAYGKDLQRGRDFFMKYKKKKTQDVDDTNTMII